jgi:hypothetical protein
LQCAIPAFDGLFDSEDNDDILQLLFVFAHWHGLAKLRMHTDPMLALLDEATTLLGVKFRRFVNHTCEKFNTRELQREANARARRAAKKSTTSSAPPSGQAELASRGVEAAALVAIIPEYHPPSTTSASVPEAQQIIAGEPPRGVGLDSPALSPPVVASPTEPDAITTRRTKTFNLDTYKYHSLGDYTEHIRQYGTTDSYSTEPVRRSHFTRLLLANYSSTGGVGTQNS